MSTVKMADFEEFQRVKAWIEQDGHWKVVAVPAAEPAGAPLLFNDGSRVFPTAPAGREAEPETYTTDGRPHNGPPLFPAEPADAGLLHTWAGHIDCDPDECTVAHLARSAEPADTGLRAALERAANEGRNVLPNATDDQASIIEQWALAALATALATAPSAPAGLDEAHPRTYSLTASGPNGELFLVTDDESGINIGHAKQIGGPLTARLATAPSAPAGLDVEPCPRCAHRSHPPHGCEARYHVTLKKGEAGDPCLCPEAALAATPSAPAGLVEWGVCGSLGWTVEKWGRVTHKHACPNRTDPWCQTHPDRCAYESDG